MTHPQRLLVTPILALSLLLAGSALAAGEEAPAGAAEEAGPALEPMADFTLPTLDGENVSLSDFLGEKVILLNFWASWCTPCMKEMPELNKMQNDPALAGLQVISVTVDEAKDLAKAKSIVKRFNYTPVVLSDAETKLVSKINPRKDMPYTLLIGKDRMVHHRKKGFTAGDEEKLREWATALLQQD